MQSNMGYLIDYFEIFQSVIRVIIVDMMHILVFLEEPANTRLNEEPWITNGFSLAIGKDANNMLPSIWSKIRTIDPAITIWIHDPPIPSYPKSPASASSATLANLPIDRMTNDLVETNPHADVERRLRTSDAYLERRVLNHTHRRITPIEYLLSKIILQKPHHIYAGRAQSLASINFFRPMMVPFWIRTLSSQKIASILQSSSSSVARVVRSGVTMK